MSKLQSVHRVLVNKQFILARQNEENTIVRLL